jgi:large conductance mechanosensitive channel
MCVLINLSGMPQPSLTATKAVKTSTINCVVSLQATVDFIVIAFVIFSVVKQVNRFKKEAPPAPPAGPPQRREISDGDSRRSEGRH